MLPFVARSDSNTTRQMDQMSGDRTSAADAADAADAAERADVVHEDRPFLGRPTRPRNGVQMKFDWIFFLNGLLGMKAFLGD